MYDHVRDYWSSSPTCKECKHVFRQKPQTRDTTMAAPPNSGRFLSRVSKPQSQIDAEKAEYEAEVVAWDAEIAAHLATHPNSRCEFCNKAMARAAIKQHQKTYTCQEKQRAQSLTQRGYVNVENDYDSFAELFVAMKKKILVGTEWDDGPARRELERQQVEAVHMFEDIANIHRCLTRYVSKTPSKSEEECGWQLEAYAPADTALALRECLRQYRKDPTKDKLMTAFYEMWAWLHADEEQRGAAVGLWELANDVSQ